jgi:hypothetical protein
MEKYKERARELLENWRYYDEDGIEVITVFEAYKIAVQLAEEVEKDMLNYFFTQKFEYSKDLFYTKQQIEELLQKQRELSYKEAITDCEEIDWDRWEHKVNKDSILNAKLEI